jgi:hypothetical protein
MALRLRARVRTATGGTRHALGTLVDGMAVEAQQLPTPAFAEIIEKEEGFYLLYLDSEGACLTDTWHVTLEAAKRQAEFEFQIPPMEWQPV